MRIALLLMLFVACGMPAVTQAPPTTRPVSIVLDTDMDSDCDDVGALAMLHAPADVTRMIDALMMQPPRK